MEPVRVGLVGAGHWASVMHGPMLAAGPETRLVGVWARRGDAADELARRLGTTAAPSFDALVERCEAVAFAVPPDAQVELGVRAARAGRALLLEKPVALSVDGAERLARAVVDGGVVSQVVLTKRYHPATRAFLRDAAAFEVSGARARYLHGGFLDGPFANGWRLAHGALLDLGPHLLDLVDAALGPVARVDRHGDPARWVELTCTHSSGTVSQLSLSGTVGIPRSRAGVELYGPQGVLEIDFATVDHAECWPVVRAEFAAAVRSGVPHALDVHHGLRLQRLLAAASDANGAGEANGADRASGGNWADDANGAAASDGNGGHDANGAGADDGNGNGGQDANGAGADDGNGNGADDGNRGGHRGGRAGEADRRAVMTEP